MRKMFILSVIGVLSGCGLLRDPVVRLWTNSVELAVYMEEYNADDMPYRVEVRFLEDPGRELAISSEAPDVVVANQLSSRTVRPFLTDLSRLFDDNRLSRDAFYPDLLAVGRVGDEQMAVPLSFNLPVLLFSHSPGTEESTQFGITPEELRSIGSQENQIVGERLVRMGFSPRWDTRFLVAFAQLRGASFEETGLHEVQFNRVALESALEELSQWVAETNGGALAEHQFHDTYLYDPLLKLLETNRIAVMYSTSREFFEIPESRRRALSFSWLWDGEQIPVLGSILHAAIPEAADNRRGAEHLLKWLLDPKIQAQLMESASDKRMPGFGFAGGFSSLRQVNIEDIVFRYDSLLGAVPADESLQFPRVLPPYWNELTASVIEPWMNRAVGEVRPSATLTVVMNSWLLTRGD